MILYIMIIDRRRVLILYAIERKTRYIKVRIDTHFNTNWRIRQVS